MKILGLVAPKQGGKDTSYELLKEAKLAHGKISFAGPLKDICSKIFGVHLTVLNDPVLKERPFSQPITLTKKHLRDIRNICEDMVPALQPDGIMLYRPGTASISGLENRQLISPRELLQIVGTDYIRDRIYKDWHLRAAFSKEALSKLVQSGLYCVTDIRFVNEYEYLKDVFKDDFKCLYIERKESEIVLEKATHPSELDTKKIRLLIPDEDVIKNEGSITDLGAKLEPIAKNLLDKARASKGSRLKWTVRK